MEWKYYNRAVIPDVLPYECVDTSAVDSGQIWKTSIGKRAILARWMSDFDCKEETSWWYLIRETPFDIDSLPSSSRKHIRQALKKCRVERISPKEKAEELYQCYVEAHSKYVNADNFIDKETFCDSCKNQEDPTLEYWAGFPSDEQRIIGYLVIKKYNDFAEILTAKFSTEFLNFRISDALYATVLEHYLNIEKKLFVSSGTRSINHVTNTQEYKERTFLYRKAYCKLHIKYNPKYGWIIKILYLMRPLLKKLDGVTLVHRINAVLRMEEIYREQKNYE